MTRTLATKITAQAEGCYAAEASALILTKALNGRLLEQLPLAFENDRMAGVDWPAARSELGHLSSGERRLLDLADSLFTGHPIDLAESLSGLDEGNARLVLRAVAHALRIRIHGGSR